MSDEEIIKRLERCVKRGNRNYDTDIVLDLINRPKSEIERVKECPKCVYEYVGEITEYCVQGPCPNFKTVEQIKTEAYKEFAGKAKEEMLNLQYNAKTDRKTVKIEELSNQMNWLLHTVAIETVENLLKEMVGEEE